MLLCGGIVGRLLGLGGAALRPNVNNSWNKTAREDTSNNYPECGNLWIFMQGDWRLTKEVGSRRPGYVPLSATLDQTLRTDAEGV